jgi:hypothetical protein
MEFSGQTVTRDDGYNAYARRHTLRKLTKSLEVTDGLTVDEMGKVILGIGFRINEQFVLSTRHDTKTTLTMERDEVERLRDHLTQVLEEGPQWESLDSDCSAKSPMTELIE